MVEWFLLLMVLEFHSRLLAEASLPTLLQILQSKSPTGGVMSATMRQMWQEISGST